MGNRKMPEGRRIHVIMDQQAVKDLDWICVNNGSYNRSQTIRDLVMREAARQAKKGTLSRRPSAR